MNGKIAPKSNVIGVADSISLTGKAESQDALMRVNWEASWYRWHAAEGFHGNKGELPGSSVACKVRKAYKARRI